MATLLFSSTFCYLVLRRSPHLLRAHDSALFSSSEQYFFTVSDYQLSCLRTACPDNSIFHLLFVRRKPLLCCGNSFGLTLKFRPSLFTPLPLWFATSFPLVSLMNMFRYRVTLLTSLSLKSLSELFSESFPWKTFAKISTQNCPHQRLTSQCKNFHSQMSCL